MTEGLCVALGLILAYALYGLHTNEGITKQLLKENKELRKQVETYELLVKLGRHV